MFRFSRVGSCALADLGKLMYSRHSVICSGVYSNLGSLEAGVVIVLPGRIVKPFLLVESDSINGTGD